MFDTFALFGLIATLTASIGFLPQVIKTWKTKKARDISFYMIILWSVSAISWIIYGLPKNDIYIVGTNAFIFSLTMLLLIFKIRFKGK
jgi:MtN3 and saliva related transmembrane protein